MHWPPPSPSNPCDQWTVSVIVDRYAMVCVVTAAIQNGIASLLRQKHPAQIVI
jgi:hypothetical protein